MLNLYRYKIQKGMMTLAEVPEPYQKMLRNEGMQDDGTYLPK